MSGSTILRKPRLVRLFPAMLLVACADAPAPSVDDDALVGDTPAPELTFAPETGVHVDSMTRTESGILIQDVSTGNGATVEAGSTAVADYTLWLPDGTVIEQRPSEDGFGSAELVIGEATPTGLNEALLGMRVGGVRRIVLPPEYGFGLVGRPAAVPAGATLVYEVRLRAVR